MYTTILQALYKKLENVEGDYSTSEQFTGSKFIDGNKIYRKYVNFDDTTVGLNSVAHGIENLKNVIKIEGAGWVDTSVTEDKFHFNIPHVFPGEEGLISLTSATNDSNAFIMYSSTEDPADVYKCYVRLYYTKNE